MHRFLGPVMALLVFAGTAATQPPTPKPEPKTAPEPLITRAYDLKSLLGSKLEGIGGANPDAVVRMILDNVSIGDLRTDGDGPQITQREGGVLEVRATELVHGQIKELLNALGRMADIAVDVKTDLVELDAASFEKEGAGLFTVVKERAGPSAVVGFSETPDTKDLRPTAALDKLVKTGKVLQTSAARYQNGVESIVSARLAVFTYRNQTSAGPALNGPLLFGKEGYQLGAVLVVSGDRRSVRARLIETAVAVVGEKKRTLGEVGGRPIVATAPDASDFGKSATVEVPTGGAILFRLDYAPKDKVWLVVLRPTVFVPADEGAKTKPEKK